jgi:hypothetical protein
MKKPRKSPPRNLPTQSEEKLDEELEESFPASDPPANTTPTSIGGPRGRGRSAPPPTTRRSAAEAEARTFATPALYCRPDDERAAVAATGLVALDHAQAFDLREAWPASHLGDKSFDGPGRATDQCLDRAIGSVAHPAGDAEPQRRAARELAIADSLDVTFDDDATDNGASFSHGALSSPWTMRLDLWSGRQMRRRS